MATDNTVPIEGRPTLNLPGKIGAGLFALWGILHIWVGYQGTVLYHASPAQEQWRMFIGGSKAPFSAFQFPSDPVTTHVHANFLAHELALFFGI